MLTRKQAADRRFEETLAKLSAAHTKLAEPMVREAIARLDAMDAEMAAHQRAQHEAQLELRHIAESMGLSVDDVRQLRKLERILARLPSLGAQPALPLDA